MSQSTTDPHTKSGVTLTQNAPVFFKFIPNAELLKELILKATTFKSAAEVSVAYAKEELAQIAASKKKGAPAPVVTTAIA